MMQVDKQERKDELMEPQKQNPASGSRSAEVWHRQSGTNLCELGWQVDRFLITKVGFLKLTGNWKRIFGPQAYQQQARRVRLEGDVG